VKIFSVFVLVLTCGLVPCQADTTPTQTWNVVAMCDGDIDFPFTTVCTVPANINAVFTTRIETGTFWDPVDEEFFVPPEGEPVVTNIAGTFDGLPMTLVPHSEPFQGYLGPSPANIDFVAGGIEYELSREVPNDIFLDSTNVHETLAFSAVENVPEPRAFWLLLTALLMLALSRWAQMSLRKLSNR
jgi:hypothetical protein